MKFKSTSVKMFPSQYRSDTYDRKARFPLDLNLANMSMSMTSKQGFVIRGCKVEDSKLKTAAGDVHSIWLAGCVFNIHDEIDLPTSGANGEIAAFYTSWFNRENSSIGIPAGRIGVIGQMSGDSYNEDRDNSEYGGLELKVISKTTLDNPNKGDYYAPVAVMENGNWVQYSNYKHRYNAEDVTVKQLKEKIKEPESAGAEQSLEQYLQYNVSIDDGSLAKTEHEKFSKIKLKRDSHENIAKATQEVDLAGSVLVDKDRRYILQGEDASPKSYKPFITNEIQGYASEFGSNGAYTAKEEATGEYRLYGAGSEVRFDVDAGTEWKIRQGTMEDIVGGNKSSSPTVTFNLSKLELKNGLEVTGSTTLNDKLTVRKNRPDGTSGIEVLDGGITVSVGEKKIEIDASGQTVTASNFRGLADEASKVTNALTIKFNNETQGEYDGSAAKTYNITPNNIGAATAAQGAKADTAIQSVALASGSNNGTLKLTIDNVATDNIAVKGLSSAAYTASTAYATATQGEKADTAIQSALFAGKAMTKTGTALSIAQADARTALGLGSAAYTASTAYATAAQGTKADKAVPVTGASNLSGDFYPASKGTVSLGKSDRPFKEVVAGSFDARSDIRLKSNITPCQVKDISQIEVKEFDLDGVEGREIGVIAQELQKQFPELVKEGSDEMRTLTVRESKIVYYLLDEVRRLKKELKEKELIA